MSGSGTVYQPPTVEDYDSDASKAPKKNATVTIEPPTPRARRQSVPSVATPKARQPGPVATQGSDSGYSSRSQPTAYSIESPQTPDSPTLARHKSSDGKDKKSRRASYIEPKSQDGPPSSYKLVNKTSSRSSSKARDSSSTDMGFDPHCRDCVSQLHDHRTGQAIVTAFQHPYSTLPLRPPAALQQVATAQLQSTLGRRTSDKRPLSLQIPTESIWDPLTAYTSPQYTPTAQYASPSAYYASARYYTEPSSSKSHSQSRRPSLNHRATEQVSASPSRSKYYYSEKRTTSRDKYKSERPKSSSHKNSYTHAKRSSKPARRDDGRSSDSSDSYSSSSTDSEQETRKVRTKAPSKKHSSKSRSESHRDSRRSSEVKSAEIKRSSRKDTKDSSKTALVMQRGRSKADIPAQTPVEEDSEATARAVDVHKSSSKSKTTSSSRKPPNESKTRDRVVENKIVNVSRKAEEYQNLVAGRQGSSNDSSSYQNVVADALPANDSPSRHEARSSPTVVQQGQGPNTPTTSRRPSLTQQQRRATSSRVDSAYDDGDSAMMAAEGQIIIDVAKDGRINFGGDLVNMSTVSREDGSRQYIISSGANREQRYINSSSTKSSGSFGQRMLAHDSERWRNDRQIARSQSRIAEE